MVAPVDYSEGHLLDADRIANKELIPSVKALKARYFTLLLHARSQCLLRGFVTSARSYL